MTSSSKLISDIEALLAAAKASNLDGLDDAARLGLLAQVEDIHHQLDDPVLAMYRHLTNLTGTAALRAVLRLGVLNHIPKDGSATTKDLAGTLKVEEEILIRMMRQLTGYGILQAVGENEYAHTKFSLVYIERSEINFFTFLTEEMAPVAQRIPEYLETHDGSAIYDTKTSPYSWANDGEGKNFYQILSETPSRLARFDKGMQTKEAAHRILGLYPLAALVDNIDKRQDRAFIVDIGGGRGQSLVSIMSELGDRVTPDLGKWILQERKPVLDGIPEGEINGIEKMPHDFFQPQPVKGAHIYYLRRILHNWQNDDSKKILKNIADAMAKDSTLLIGEMVIPAKAGPNKYIYLLDVVMFMIGGKERTATEFSSILDSVGLKLIKVWISKAGDQTVIECRLK
ncbi:O-methyltransferase [Halenospora varia]|nr:O-methyltransferase [Halenospora varia]